MQPNRAPLLFVALIFPGCASLIGDNAPVTPQRPTIASDTATTAEGTLEIEMGGVIDPGDSADTPTTIKWGAGPRTEIFSSWSPYRQVALPGPDADGVSDMQVGVRHRFLEQEGGRPSAALQLITSLPTGDRSQGLSSGEIDFLPAVMLLQNFEDFSANAFYQAGILGNSAGGTDLEHTIALGAATSVGERWGVFAELASILNHESDIENYLATVGGSYAVSRSLSLDAGATFGINDEAPDVQILFGLTSNLGAPSSWLSR